jgi:hypothetical protein
MFFVSTVLSSQHPFPSQKQRYKLTVFIAARSGDRHRRIDPVISNRLISSEHEGISLSNIDIETVHCKGGVQDPIGLDDSHPVSLNAESELSEGARVDEPESVSLAGLDVYD